MGSVAFQPGRSRLTAACRKRATGGYAYFRCRQGPHDSGTRFRLRTTRCWTSGDCWVLEEVVDDGVGAILGDIIALARLAAEAVHTAEFLLDIRSSKACAVVIGRMPGTTSVSVDCDAATSTPTGPLLEEFSMLAARSLCSARVGLARRCFFELGSLISKYQ